MANKRRSARKSNPALVGKIGGDVMSTRIRVPLSQVMGADGSKIEILRLAPRFFSLSADLSKYYQFYRIRRATLRFESISPMTSTGAVAFGYFQNPVDGNNWYNLGTVDEKQNRIVTLQHHMFGHRSKNMSMTLNAAELMGSTPWKDVGVGGTTTGDTLFKDCGVVAIMHSGGASGDVFGTLTVEMDLDFKGFTNPAVNSP